MRGATSYARPTPARHTNFNPRSSCEERPFSAGLSTCSTKFQSTLLMRGATYRGVPYLAPVIISIHAPHARSDTRQRRARQMQRNFNPRSSCEERRLALVHAGRSAISIHAPHARSDWRLQSCTGARRTISIHAPHARSDSARPSATSKSSNFNPRSSCEERRGVISLKTADRIFQSTLLMRGATVIPIDVVNRLWISIHAPHARSDATSIRYLGYLRHFNPRSSCEERPASSRTYTCGSSISIHAPHARSDVRARQSSPRARPISIHAPHARSDQALCQSLLIPLLISIHAPHARSD